MMIHLILKLRKSLGLSRINSVYSFRNQILNIFLLESNIAKVSERRHFKRLKKSYGKVWQKNKLPAFKLLLTGVAWLQEVHLPQNDFESIRTGNSRGEIR